VIHRDEVHGDIRYDDLAEALLDTPQLQRLGRVYQLGFGHLVYRGGNHTRLSHAMGTYLTASGLARALQRNYEFDSALPEGAIRPQEFLPLRAGRAPDHPEVENGREELQDRWTVLRHLVCWAALLHDIGHVPLGHTLEDEFDGIYERHDAITSPRLKRLWLDPSSDIRKGLESTHLYPEAFARVGITNGADVHLAVLLICTWKEKAEEDGKRETFQEILEAEKKRREEEGEDPGIADDLLQAVASLQSSLFHPFMADLVANTISADYLDYLRRDPHNLGLDVLRDGRIVSRFWIGRDNRGQARMALSLVDRRGKPRLDTCTSVVELVRQRFRFAEIVYYHKTKVAASAMLAKAFHLLEKPPELPRSRTLPTVEDAGSWAERLLAPDTVKGRTKVAGEFIAECTPTSLLDPEVGDEGLDFVLRNQAFEQIREAVKKGDEAELVSAVRGIALLDALARRELYKTAFKMSAKSFFEIKGHENESQQHELTDFIQALRSDSEARERIEKKMVEAAGFPDCAILLYVPDRKSQAKGIETGALFDGTVTTLGSHWAVEKDVANLSEKYKNLWHLMVFVHPDYASDPVALSKAVDAFVTDQFPNVELMRGGVIKELERGAWFPYQRASLRPAAERFTRLMEGSLDGLGWEAFERYGAENEGCTARQHSLGAALVQELIASSRPLERDAAVELVAKLGAAETVEQKIDEKLTAAGASIEGEADGETPLLGEKAALAALAAELRKTRDRRA
jgi:HD superfamily phosphohydrolase